MAGRSRSRKNVSQQTRQDASTQTSPDKILNEINRLKEEVNLLQQQLSSQVKRKERSNAVFQAPKEMVSVAAVEDSPKGLRILGKGCSCKGKCASRSCGCVKKQFACTEFCKCQHAKCQNKEPNKENIADPNARAQLSVEQEKNVNRLSELQLSENIQDIVTDEAAGPSNKQMNQGRKTTKSIFSPDTPSTDGYISKKNLNFDSDSSASSPEKKEKRKSKATKVVHRRKLAEKKQTEIKVDQVSIDVAATAGGESDQLQNKENLDKEPEFVEIDPMKPTHQLQRTPVSASSNTSHVRTSESPVSFMKQEKMEEPSITLQPEGIDTPVVNWEEHCAQLVRCKFCKRTFYPFRLAKHEASCKRV